MIISYIEGDVSNVITVYVTMQKGQGHIIQWQRYKSISRRKLNEHKIHYAQHSHLEMVPIVSYHRNQ